MCDHQNLFEGEDRNGRGLEEFLVRVTRPELAAECISCGFSDRTRNKIASLRHTAMELHAWSTRNRMMVSQSISYDSLGVDEV